MLYQTVSDPQHPGVSFSGRKSINYTGHHKTLFSPFFLYSWCRTSLEQQDLNIFNLKWLNFVTQYLAHVTKLHIAMLHFRSLALVRVPELTQLSYHILWHLITCYHVRTGEKHQCSIYFSLGQHFSTFRPLVIACFPFVFKAWAKDSNNFCRTCSHRGRGTLWRFGHEHYFYNIYIYIYLHVCVCAYVYVCVCICTFVYIYIFILFAFVL